MTTEIKIQIGSQHTFILRGHRSTVCLKFVRTVRVCDGISTSIWRSITVPLTHSYYFHHEPVVQFLFATDCKLHLTAFIRMVDCEYRTVPCDICCRVTLVLMDRVISTTGCLSSDINYKSQISHENINIIQHLVQNHMQLVCPSHPSKDISLGFLFHKSVK